MNRLVIGFLLGTTAVCLMAAAMSPPSELVIQISNPYSFDVDAEVKCDWNEEKKAFEFHQRFVFPANQITKLQIPKAQKSCEIWPHVQLFE